MSLVLKLLAEKIRERIKKLEDDLKQPENKGHLASIIQGEFNALEWVLDLIEEKE
jgi:hypothetical protein